MIKVLIKVSKSGIVDNKYNKQIKYSISTIESKSSMASIARIIKEQRMSARSARSQIYRRAIKTLKEISKPSK